MSATPDIRSDTPGAIVNQSQVPVASTGQKLALVALVGFIVASLVFIVRDAINTSLRSACKGHLGQIGLALQNYYVDYHAYPPAYTVDAIGKPLHSWRTLILPYLNHEMVYNSINLSKPWDDPDNSKVFQNSDVATYQCLAARMPMTSTTYLAIVGKNYFFDPTRARKKSEVTDGLSKTLAVIEVSPDRAVPWMSPVDAYDDSSLGLESGAKRSHIEGTHAVTAQGRVYFLKATRPFTESSASMTINGHDNICDDY